MIEEAQDLKVSTEMVATREVTLTIEPDADVIERAMRRAARQISRVRPIAGYRPGRAPYVMVERVFGRDLILEQALNDVASDIYRQAITEAGIEPYEQGQLDIESRDPLVLKARVALTPTVELGDYRALYIDQEPPVTLTEEQIDEQVEIVRRRHAEYEPVERPIAMGDQILASVKGISDGEEVVSQENATIDLSDELMPPGFAEALIGTEPGQERQFSLTYPDDYGDESLAGKNVDFTVTVHVIREVKLPDINDDLAKMAGDYETLEELRQALAQQLQERLEAEAKQRESEAAIEALVANTEVAYPKAALDREVEAVLDRYKSQLRQMGFDFDAYLRMTGQTEQQLREEVRPQAEQQLVRRLVLSEFLRAEDISMSREEMDQEIEGVASSFASVYGDRAEEAMRQFQASGGMVSILSDRLMQKAVEHLRELLTGRLAPESEPVQDATQTNEVPPESARDSQ